MLTLLFSCNSTESPTIDNTVNENKSTEKSSPMLPKETVSAPKLDLTEANRLSKLPLGCMDTEYPNKLSQVLSSAEDLKSPSVLHPTFYGCFDWHSAVHGHWSLIRLLKAFPELENTAEIKEKLATRMS